MKQRPENGKIFKNKFGIKDFEKIQEQLSQISMAIDSLQLWVQKAIAEGRIDKKD